MGDPTILEERTAYSLPWFDVVGKVVKLPGTDDAQTYWGLRAADCVSVVALTHDGRIPLVRQFRPVVEQTVLELPSGHIEPGERPEDAAIRELREETGHTTQEIHLMGQLIADSGRLEYSQWCYFAVAVAMPSGASWRAEPGVEVVFYTPAQLHEMLRRGGLKHAQHVAALALAIAQGRFPL